MNNVQHDNTQEGKYDYNMQAIHSVLQIIFDQICRTISTGIIGM